MDGIGTEAARRLAVAAAEIKELQDAYCDQQDIIRSLRDGIERNDSLISKANHSTGKHQRHHELLLHHIDSINRRNAKLIEENRLLDDERSNIKLDLQQAQRANDAAVDDINRLVEALRLVEGERQRATVVESTVTGTARQLSARKKQAATRSNQQGSALNMLQIRSGKCNVTSNYIETVLKGI